MDKSVETMAAIEKLLVSGHTAKEVIGQGYAKSTVFAVQKKLRGSQLSAPVFEPDDEVVELRRRKEILKLEKEIADIEATKEKLPDRVEALEKEVVALRRLVREAVDSALFICMWKYGGVNEDEAEKYADGWVARVVQPILDKR